MPHTLLAHILLQAIPPTAQAARAAKQMDPIALVLHASTIVQAVLIILTLMGLFYIFIMSAKTLHVFTATQASRRFLDLF